MPCLHEDKEPLLSNFTEMQRFRLAMGENAFAGEGGAAL